MLIHNLYIKKRKILKHKDGVKLPAGDEQLDADEVGRELSELIVKEGEETTGTSTLGKKY